MKIHTPFQNLFFVSSALSVMLILATSAARADFYVIPVIQKVKNVVAVAKSGGQFTDVQAAIDSIGDAGADNPYLVYIGPGIYTVTGPVQLKTHMTVMGSGRNVTQIKGAISTNEYATSAIILGADHATLTRLNVENTGGEGNNSVGIYNSGASPALDEITVIVSGGIYNFGVINKDSTPIMINVTVTASGGSLSCGVDNEQSNPTMTDITATAFGGTTINYGVFNVESSPTMTSVTARGSGGSNDNDFGVYNDLYSSPTIRSCMLQGDSYAVFSKVASSPRILNSFFNGFIGADMGSGVIYHCIGNYDTYFQPAICPSP